MKVCYNVIVLLAYHYCHITCQITISKGLAEMCYKNSNLCLLAVREGK